MGLDEAFVAVPAAQGAGVARTLVGFPPGLQRRGRGGGRILRIERNQHDLVRSEGGHGAGGLCGGGRPVAHGDEGLDLVGRAQTGKGGAQRFGLGLRFLQQRRAAPHVGVVGLGQPLAALGDEPGQRPADDSRQADDGWIGEQVLQEGPHVGLVVGAAQVEEHHGDAPPRAFRTLTVATLDRRRTHPQTPVTRRTTASMCSTGVSGSTPWPRLKM